MRTLFYRHLKYLSVSSFYLFCNIVLYCADCIVITRIIIPQIQYLTTRINNYIFNGFPMGRAYTGSQFLTVGWHAITMSPHLLAVSLRALYTECQVQLCLKLMITFAIRIYAVPLTPDFEFIQYRILTGFTFENYGNFTHFTRIDISLMTPFKDSIKKLMGYAY